MHILREAMKGLCQQNTSKACLPQSGQKFTDHTMVHINFYTANSSKTFNSFCFISLPH